MSLSDSFWEDLSELQEICYNTADKSGFHDVIKEGTEEIRSLRISQCLMLIVSEAVEAFDDQRNGESVSSWYVNEFGKPCGFPTELADIIIRTFDLAGICGVDLSKVIDAKMRYNATRPRLHGKKF